MLDKFLFLKEWLKKPKAIGALLPSSTKLVDAIVAEVPKTAKKIVELGAGTGVITESLLHHGFTANQIISIEKNPAFIARLRKKFPEVTFIEGDAKTFMKVYPDLSHNVDVVISGLPIRLWDKSSLLELENQLYEVLSPNGLFIQFTYQIYQYKSLLSESFELFHLHKVWWNIPPALVEVFQLRQSH